MAQRSHTITVKVPAHYVWLLVFDYDNTGNEGTIKHEYVRTQTVSYDRNTVEELLAEETSKINSSTSIDGNAGFTLGKFSAKISDEYSQDANINTVLSSLARTNEGSGNTTKETLTEIIEIVPKSRTCLYQRAFMNEGISIKTGQFRTTNNPLSDPELFEESSVTYSVRPSEVLLGAKSHEAIGEQLKLDLYAFPNTAVLAKEGQSKVGDVNITNELIYPLSTTPPSLRTCRWLEGVWGPATSKAINRFELQQVATLAYARGTEYLKDEVELDDRSGIKDRPNHILIGRDLRSLFRPAGMSPSSFVTHYYLVPYKERDNDEVITKIYLSNEGPTKDSLKSLKFLDLSDRVYDKGWTERGKWLVWEVSKIGTGIVSE